MSERFCLDCGSDISGKRADAQFCGAGCKKRWQRKEAKRLAAEEGDPSVVWDGSQDTTNSEPSSKDPKKKSTSHVTELKKRVKAKILGKTEAHYITANISKADLMALGDMAETPDRLEACPQFTARFSEKSTLAQNVLSRLTSKIQSSPTVIPKGTTIK